MSPEAIPATYSVLFGAPFAFVCWFPRSRVTVRLAWWAAIFGFHLCGYFSDMAEYAGIEFSAEENAVIDLSQTLPDATTFSEAWLVGRVLSFGPVSMRGLRSAMTPLWRTNQRLEIREFGENLFTVRCFSSEDRDRILDSGPWNFDKFHIVLSVLEPDDDPAAVPLNKIPFWVQVQNLPMGHRSEVVARALGSAIGEYLGWDSHDRSRLGGSLRVRVNVDVSRPLLRSKVLARGAKAPLRVVFKYERLSAYCFRCGVLTHQIRECPFPAPEIVGGVQPPLPFGPWLRADSSRNGSSYGGRNHGHDNSSDLRAGSSHKDRSPRPSPSVASHGGGGAPEDVPRNEPAVVLATVDAPDHGEESGAGSVSMPLSKKRKQDEALGVLDDGNTTVREHDVLPRSGAVLGEAGLDSLPPRKILFDAISADAAGQRRRKQ